MVPRPATTLTLKQIEKVPRSILGEKSSKDTASSRNLVSTIEAQESPEKGTGPGVRKGKHSLLACHTRCKCSMETTHNSVKVKGQGHGMASIEKLKGLVTRIMHAIYQCSIINTSEDISQVKVFVTEGQRDGRTDE